MLVDSRLKPELVAAKAPPSTDGGPVKHDAKEHLFIFPELAGLTPMPVGENERAAVIIATDGRSAVAVPAKMVQRFNKAPEPGLDGKPAPENTLQLLFEEDQAGPFIPAALAHARKNLVAPKTASLDLLAGETVTPDNAAFPRIYPGADTWILPDSANTTGRDLTFAEKVRISIGYFFGNLGPTEATECISFCPFRLLALARAMGVKEGEGITVLFRGTEGEMSVIPLKPSACNPGEALGILMPFKAATKAEDEQ